MSTTPDTPRSAEETVAQVRDRYTLVATGGMPSCCDTEPLGYDPRVLATVPASANLRLGCGAPIGRLALRAGETVLDLGSGPGLDALLAAHQVGPTGRVIGVDMTPAMLERARGAAAEAGIGWAEFRAGRLEALPVAAASIDAVTSNCVINLVPDKVAVFREIVRVLRPGGRLVVSDIVLDGALPAVVADDLLAWAGCIAGAAPRAAYLAWIASAGLTGLAILEDFDYLEAIDGALPEPVRERMAAAGVPPGALRGVVRSITWEARRPA
ncbi:MAG TPA: methyltransferase domain-containing protein [Dongiaceae bacterium]|nr:methyltransferase domain-containing protein [Dongiaceae bacterium]